MAFGCARGLLIFNRAPVQRQRHEYYGLFCKIGAWTSTRSLEAWFDYPVWGKGVMEGSR
jgi:hypothetical protein